MWCVSGKYVGIYGRNSRMSKCIVLWEMGGCFYWVGLLDWWMVNGRRWCFDVIWFIENEKEVWNVLWVDFGVGF